MRTIFCFLLIVLISQTAGYGQGTYTVGISFPYISHSWTEVGLNSAVGGGVNFAYGVNSSISASVCILVARHDMKENTLILSKSNSTEPFISSRWTLGWLMGSVNYYILDSAYLKPFINGELGFGFLASNFENMLDGFALGGGGGVEHFFDEHWSLNAAVTLRYTYLNGGSVGGENIKLANPLSQLAVGAQTGVAYRF